MHPLVADAPAFAIQPRCAHYYHGGWRCSDPATTWLVSPNGQAIMVVCDQHAAACLDEYAAASADVPELAGWRGVPVQVRP